MTISAMSNPIKSNPPTGILRGLPVIAGLEVSFDIVISTPANDTGVEDDEYDEDCADEAESD